MIRRGLAVLAILAASVGAPSVAFGAGNILVPGLPDPTIGTTETVFRFSVRYEGRFDATGVTASVAGLSLPMTLVDGTPASGTWTAATQLPAGAWAVSYAATVTQGNAPTASGGAVTVTELEEPSPMAQSSEAVAPPPATPPPARISPTAAPTPAPAQQPAAGTGEGSSTTGGAASPAGAGTAPALSPPPADASAGGGPASTTGSPEAAPARPDAAGPSRSGGGAQTAVDEVTGRPGDSPSATPGGLAPDGPVALAPLIGAIAAAAMLFGLVGLLAGRRPRPAEADAAGGAEPSEAVPDPVANVLQQRTLRRARIRLEDDPIVAALIEPDAERTTRQRARRPRASEVQRGPGVRERDG